jgi:hypothetical protein
VLSLQGPRLPAAGPRSGFMNRRWEERGSEGRDSWGPRRPPRCCQAERFPFGPQPWRCIAGPRPPARCRCGSSRALPRGRPHSGHTCLRVWNSARFLGPGPVACPRSRIPALGPRPLRSNAGPRRRPCRSVKAARRSRPRSEFWACSTFPCLPCRLAQCRGLGRCAFSSERRPTRAGGPLLRAGGASFSWAKQGNAETPSASAMRDSCRFMVIWFCVSVYVLTSRTSDTGSYRIAAS